ncbi:hypothetical protein BDQ17DRAFT_1244784 [Cyathus striatus]|nr:hypothetical protein BDQ17DRAFT_1244784 [Cyathus striatus]
MVAEIANTRPLKRLRSKGPNDLPRHVEPRRPIDLWFDDGSIILETEDNAQFKVYHRTLSRYSPVLRERLDVLLSLEKQESVEGCPLLRMDDAGSDMEHLLKALFDLRYYDSRDPQPFVCVSAVWRLATKYEIGFLVEDSVSRFKTKYPMNLKDFYQRDFANKIIMTPGQHYDVIDLARKMNMLWILPSAFFLCWHNRNYRVNISKGMPRPDKSIATLSMHDQEALISSWDQIHTTIAYKVFAWLNVDKYPSPRCKNPLMCSKIRTAIASRLILPDNIPLRGWSAQPYVEHLCTPCTYIVKPAYELALEKFWDDLPSYFGLPGWGQLLAGHK